MAGKRKAPVRTEATDGNVSPVRSSCVVVHAEWLAGGVLAPALVHLDLSGNGKGSRYIYWIYGMCERQQQEQQQEQQQQRVCQQQHQQLV